MEESALWPNTAKCCFKCSQTLWRVLMLCYSCGLVADWHLQSSASVSPAGTYRAERVKEIKPNLRQSPESFVDHPSLLVLRILLTENVVGRYRDFAQRPQQDQSIWQMRNNHCSNRLRLSQPTAEICYRLMHFVFDYLVNMFLKVTTLHFHLNNVCASPD